MSHHPGLHRTDRRDRYFYIGMRKSELGEAVQHHMHLFDRQRDRLRKMLNRGGL